MKPITGIIILGISIIMLGVFLIVAGYGTSMTGLWFGVSFVLVGGLYAAVLPILTPYITPQYIEQEAPPQPESNSDSRGLEAPRTRSESESAQSLPRVDRARRSGRGE